PFGYSEQFLSGPSPIMMRSQLVQHLTQSDDVGLCNGLCAGIALKECQGSRSCGISKHLGELGEEHRQQGVDLVFVAHHVIAELLLETDQFPIGCHLLTGHIAKTGFSAEQGTCNRRGIHLVRFGSQTSLLCKGMHLSWMQQTHAISSLEPTNCATRLL